MKELIKECYQTAKDKGFWDNQRNVGEMLMLVTSELGEAMEAHRKDKVANIYKFNIERQTTPFHEESATKAAFELYIKDTLEDEIADAVIRLFDFAGGLNIDLETHIRLKLDYNKTREKLHGKKY